MIPHPSLCNEYRSTRVKENFFVTGDLRSHNRLKFELIRGDYKKKYQTYLKFLALVS